MAPTYQSWNLQHQIYLLRALSILHTPITRVTIQASLTSAPVSTLTANQLPLDVLIYRLAIVWSVPVLS